MTAKQKRKRSPRMYTQYAIKIGGSIWTGDYPDLQYRFDTYEEAEKAISDMHERNRKFEEMCGKEYKPRAKYSVMVREVTPWRKAKKPESKEEKHGRLD